MFRQLSALTWLILLDNLLKQMAYLMIATVLKERVEETWTSCCKSRRRHSMSRKKRGDLRTLLDKEEREGSCQHA